MAFSEPAQVQQSLRALRRLTAARAPQERCDLCGAALSREHEHLFAPATRRLACACQACALLFSGDGPAKHRRVPTESRLLQGFRLTDAQWDSLLLPINLAYFFTSSVENRVVALYPSPAGPVESQLSLATWQEVVADNPQLAALPTDVVALLVNRLARGGDREYYLTPIDQCFKLVGIIRTHWRGLSGGTEVWQQVERFFADLRARSVPSEEAGS